MTSKNRGGACHVKGKVAGAEHARVVGRDLARVYRGNYLGPLGDGDLGENQPFNSAGSWPGEAVRVVSQEIAMRLHNSFRAPAALLPGQD
jgi:hypothetical protein